jgi:hypothetical protein
MSLSEHEWRVLAAIEVDTRRSDPAFADALAGPAGDPRRRQLQRFTAVWAAGVTAVLLLALATGNARLAALGPLLVLSLPPALSWYRRRLGLPAAPPPPAWPPVH